jgi:hypothetical protein
LCAKIFNSTISPKTGFTPYEMVFGAANAGKSFLELESPAPAHHLVKNNKVHIETLTKEIGECTRIAQERLAKLREVTNERLNKNKIDKDFAVNDYVFCIDRSFTPGAARPLRTKLNPSPYVVVRVLYTTVLVKRIADGLKALYSKNMLKVYKGGSKLFADIPDAVRTVLLHKFEDLLDSDFIMLTKLDPLSIPDSLPLTNWDKPDKNSVNKSDAELEEEYLASLDRLELADTEQDNALLTEEPDNDNEDDHTAGITLRGGKKVHFG